MTLGEMSEFKVSPGNIVRPSLKKNSLNLGPGLPL
jgi:hypothetical protein